MTFETWVAFAVMNLVYSAPPGPNAAVLLAAASKGGIRGGAGALVGILLAEMIWAGLAVLIVSGTLDLDVMQPGILDAVGPCALILFGLSMLRKRAPVSAALSQNLPDSGAVATRRAGVAFFIGITNPLSMVFFVSVAPMFLAGATITPLSAVAFLSAALVSCAAAHAPYLGFARLGRPSLSALIERVCGGVLCSIGAVGLVGIAA